MKWIKTEDRLPNFHEVLKVRRENGNVVKAYFHKDKMEWLKFYCKGPLSHFQDHKSLEFLFDVIEWQDNE